MIYELSVRALRRHREQQKHIHEHRNLQEALQQTTSDLDEMVNLADFLYETNQRMGAVIDYLLKERGAVASGESDSFEIVLNRVLNQLEGAEGDRTGGTESPAPAGDVTMAENPASTEDPSGATEEQLWSKPGLGEEGDGKCPFSAAGRR